MSVVAVAGVPLVAARLRRRPMITMPFMASMAFVASVALMASVAFMAGMGVDGGGIGQRAGFAVCADLGLERVGRAEDRGDRGTRGRRRGWCGG